MTTSVFLGISVVAILSLGILFDDAYSTQTLEISDIITISDNVFDTTQQAVTLFENISVTDTLNTKAIETNSGIFQSKQIPTDVNFDEINQASSSLLIPFIENVGQEDDNIKFYADTFAGRVFLTDNNLTYDLNADSGTFVIRESFLSGSILDVQGLNQHDMKVSYFIGNDPKKWYSDIPTYDGVSLGTVWDGIDVSLYAYGNNVEKIFTVNPSFDASAIQLSFDEISKIQLDENGDLVLFDDTSSVISMSAPIAYQTINEEKIDVPVKYEIIDDVTYGFTVGNYDESYPLIIDPLLEATWLGGEARETNEFEDIDIDSNGDVFVVARYHGVSHSDGDSDVYIEGIASATISGHAQSAINLRPGTVVSDPDTGRWGDVVIFKLNNELSEILQATYVGDPSGEDSWPMLAIGNDDTVYVSGETNSTSFPEANPNSVYSTQGNLFVSQFSNDLMTLHESLVFGGVDGYDENFELDIDSNGDLFLMGETNSTSLTMGTGLLDDNPLGAPNEHDETIKDTASFIIKIKGDLSDVMDSAFIGGTGYDKGQHMLVDPYDNPVIVGYSNSDDILGTDTSGFTPIQEFNAGGNGGWHYGESYGAMDLFLTKFSNDLSSANSTFIGGEGFEAWPNMAISPVDGTIYVGSETKGATNFPGIDNTSISDGDTLIDGTKINDILNRIAYVDPDTEANDFILSGVTDKNKLKTIAIGVIDYTNSLSLSPTQFTLTCVTEDDYNNVPDCNTLATVIEIIHCDDIADEIGILDCNDGLNDAYGYPGWVEKQAKLLTKDGDLNTFQYKRHDTYAPLVNLAFKIDNDLQGGLKSTYFPYSSAQGFSSLAIDSQGSVYLAGQAGNRDLPNLVGGIHEEALGGTDTFVTKINAAFTEIIQTTLIGSSKGDDNPEIHFDSDDNLFVLSSASNDNAVLSQSVNDNAAQKTVGGGGGDFWVMKLSADLLSVEALAALLVSSSDNGGCDDCIDPTFYYSQHRIIVKDGFTYNDYSTDVIGKHTETPLLQTKISQMNYLILKAFDNFGTDDITWIDVGFGVPGMYHSFDDSEVTIEVELKNNAIVDTKIKDRDNLMTFGNVSSSIVDCGYIQEDCLQVTIPHTFQDNLSSPMIIIRAIDDEPNSKTHYINDGLEIQGKSINPTSYDRVYIQKYLGSPDSEWVKISLVDRVQNLWESEDGIQFLGTDGTGYKRITPLEHPLITGE